MRTVWFVCLAALLTVSTHGAQQAPPVLTAPVNDFANILDAATQREIDRRIRALEAASGDVVVVATVRTIAPFGTIEEYAVRMFENGGRGIGAKGRDNGLLLLVALEERQIRIEVGYDLEAFITDGFAGETIRETMRPHFQRGNFGQGVLLGATRLIERIAQARDVALRDAPPATPSTPGPGISWLPLILIILFILLSSRNNRRRRRRRRWASGPWSGWNSGVGPFGGGMFGGGLGGFGGRRGGSGGGGFGGGFGGFGGGRSGGGGATGGW